MKSHFPGILIAVGDEMVAAEAANPPECEEGAAEMMRQEQPEKEQQ
ncbi:MAG: hypothetical protein LUH00_11985 [Lachnospiraceae bacterium]|nr:hypothetical protein [Lachnospiraceae bacterium]